MIESLSLEKENIIKDMRNLFRLKKEAKAIKDRILRETKNLFEYEEEFCYKPIIANIFAVRIILNIKVKSKEKKFSVEQYLNKIKFKRYHK